jgi:cysteine desulfurase
MPYFDHNATTPLSAAARMAWLQAQEEAWQNPASPHRAGARVKALFERERGRLAELLGGGEENLVFTSGATEGANAAMAHLAAHSAPTARVFINPTEHSCVRAAAERWFHGRIESLPIDPNGVVSSDALDEGLSAGGAALVAVMAANNETGVVQPISALAAACARHRVPLLCDAVQWLGKRPAAEVASADFLLASAHKFGGPKGVGFLRLPAGAPARGFSFITGGGQQGGRRAGTEDYPAVAALVAALAEAETALVQDGGAPRLTWRNRYEEALLAAVPGTRIVGSGAERLWNTVMAILPQGANLRWVTKLDKRGCAVGTSAACTAAQGQSSQVLAALGFSKAEAQRAVRFSSGWATTEADWSALLAAVIEVRNEIAATELT